VVVIEVDRQAGHIVGVVTAAAESDRDASPLPKSDEF
jgi:hypothetical protein